MFRAWLWCLILVISFAFGEGAAGQTPQLYRQADSSGQLWESTDSVWLGQWVAMKNALIANPEKPKAPVVNYGVNPERFPKVEAGHEKITGAGPSLSESPGRPDVFVTVIGSSADRILKEWEADPTFARLEREMGGRLAIKSYPKGYPTNAGLKIEAGGAPDVLIQTANGNEFKRFYSDPGATAIVGQIREADPDYSPQVDPMAFDLSSPLVLMLVAVLCFGFVVSVVLMLVVVVRLIFRKHS